MGLLGASRSAESSVMVRGLTSPDVRVQAGLRRHCGALRVEFAPSRRAVWIRSVREGLVGACRRARLSRNVVDALRPMPLAG